MFTFYNEILVANKKTGSAMYHQTYNYPLSCFSLNFSDRIPTFFVQCSLFNPLRQVSKRSVCTPFRWWGRWGEPILGNYHRFRILQSHGPLRRMVISELSTFRTNCLDFPLKMHRLSYNPQNLDEKSKAVSSQVFALNNNRIANQFSKCIF